MTISPTAALLDLLTRVALAPSDAWPLNRCSLEGVRWTPRGDGVLEAAVQTLELTALGLSLGPLALEVDRLVVHDLSAQLRWDGGAPRWSALQIAAAELSGVKLSGRVADLPPMSATADLSTSHAPADCWCFGPLEAAEGTIHGTITDAQLLFDAKVTVPIRRGQIDFNDTAVEHIGPDSRMGVSRLGIYVDAPTGRSYLYQFASAPLVGVAFEQRDALFGPWVSERGKLWLQAFAEALVGRADMGQNQGLTEQARLLLRRTALSGQVRLGDAPFAAPGFQGRTESSADGRNTVALTSPAVGDGLGVSIADLAVRDLAAHRYGLRVLCDAISAGVQLDLIGGEPDTMFSLALQEVRMGRLRLER